jgi:hypothetical protein
VYLDLVLWLYLDYLVNVFRLFSVFRFSIRVVFIN